MRWLEAALLGSVATTIAIIAIAAFGLLMLWGRIDLRRGTAIILGCFLIFGAPWIASGLWTGVATEPRPTVDTQIQPPPSRARAPQSTATPIPYDPYAGASVQPR
ncbi:TrbC/VirB2 family protein [Sphingomonas sp.]|uniref:TrbC/VirB2 family protein n=1 Tax=Sphingomonas sp. TaxID=28214 RepID=UPI0025DB73AA|nr:TrbC/VirB2 family protein [Sphingomonas sp.]